MSLLYFDFLIAVLSLTVRWFSGKSQRLKAVWGLLGSKAHLSEQLS